MGVSPHTQDMETTTAIVWAFIQMGCHYHTDTLCHSWKWNQSTPETPMAASQSHSAAEPSPMLHPFAIPLPLPPQEEVAP